MFVGVGTVCGLTISPATAPLFFSFLCACACFFFFFFFFLITSPSPLQLASMSTAPLGIPGCVSLEMFGGDSTTRSTGPPVSVASPWPSSHLRTFSLVPDFSSFLGGTCNSSAGGSVSVVCFFFPPSRTEALVSPGGISTGICFSLMIFEMGFVSGHGSACIPALINLLMRDCSSMFVVIVTFCCFRSISTE